MRTYRDYLDERGVPKGPWVVRDKGLKRDSGETACGLDPKDESPGSASAEIAQIIPLKRKSS